MTKTYDMVYKWFGILKNEYNADVVAYAIMPNHLHFILHFHNEDFDLAFTNCNSGRLICLLRYPSGFRNTAVFNPVNYSGENPAVTQVLNSNI